MLANARNTFLILSLTSSISLSAALPELSSLEPLEFNEDSQRLVARGDARLDFDNTRIRADRITYYQEYSLADANGNVAITREGKRLIADRLSFDANYSFISDNFFENLGGIADIALNAPKHKLGVGAKYRFLEQGLALGARLRYRDAYKMSSGVYVGDVEAKTVLDVDVTYDLPINLGNGTVTAFLNATNLFDSRKQEFIGAPEIGRLIYGGITGRF